MNEANSPLVVAVNGLPGRAPDCIQDSLLAAHVVGADVLLLDVDLTADGHLVCATDAIVKRMGLPGGVNALDIRTINGGDAGKGFRGRFETEESVLEGSDEGWLQHGRQPRSRLLTLAEAARSCDGVSPIIVRLARAGLDYAAVLPLLLRDIGPFISENLPIGLAVPAEAVLAVRQQFPRSIQPLVIAETSAPIGNTLKYAEVHNVAAIVSFDSVLNAPPIPCRRKHRRAGLSAGDLLSVPQDGRRYTKEEMARLFQHPMLWGVAPSDLLRTFEGTGTIPAILEDDLYGPSIDRRHWRAGYSRANDDTRWSATSRGFAVTMREGGAYSGAGLALDFPVRGDFEADVTFEVDNPMQGTTLELCAINVNPGEHQALPTDGRIEEHPAYDVHGGSPYVGVESDEGDGFRIICSRGSTILTPNRQNVFNTYGRDVGAPAAHSGSLRLVRRGAAWAAFCRYAGNADWLSCGALVNESMNREVYLRLAAKHWSKAGATPPRNEARFSRFRLAKRAPPLHMLRNAT